jgi:hypothetical protein
MANVMKTRLLKYDRTTIKHLQVLTDNNLQMIANNERGISFKGLQNFCLAAQEAKEGSAPPSKDHCKEDNPCISKYGLDRWEAEFDKSSYMSSYVSIKKLIKHMYNATNDIFVGTVLEDDWVWYHNALSLMTSKETIMWMKEMIIKINGYFQNLIYNQRCLVWSNI